MDYDDNEFQSQNLQLAGEGNTKFPPVLRPYALPKFDFDDNLHGHLRFDSLVETEVFLGIESNEDNQWIEDFSRGNSGIEFRTSAAESCSISRHYNVWSEATSSESVEMLLKSVGQDENIPEKSVVRESDACDELGCLIKQMESGSKYIDNSLSKARDVADARPTVPPNQTSEFFLGSEEDVVGGQPPLAVTAPNNEAESSVEGGLSGPVQDVVSVKGGIPLMEGNAVVDQEKVDTLVDYPSNRTEKDSSASGNQAKIVSTCAPNIGISSSKLNKQDALHQDNEITETVNGLQTENDKQVEEHHFVQESEMNDQNLDGNVFESGTACSGKPPCLSSMMESMEEGNAVESNIGYVGEPSNRLLKCSDLHIVEGCSEDAQVGKSENQHLVKYLETGDLSKVNIHGKSVVINEYDNSSQWHGVEVSNVNNSSVSLLHMEDDKLSKGEGDERGSGYGGGVPTYGSECSAAERQRETEVFSTTKGGNGSSGGISTFDVECSAAQLQKETEVTSPSKCGNVASGGISTSDVECSAAELQGETEVTFTSKGGDVASGVSREHSNAEVNVSSFIPAESTEIQKENVVSRQSVVHEHDQDIPSDVTKSSTELRSDCSNKGYAIGECLVMNKEAESLSLANGSKTNELIVSNSLPDATAGNGSDLENANLASRDTIEGVLIPSSNIAVVKTAVIHQEAQMMDGCGIESSSLGEGSTAKELMGSKSHSDSTAANESGLENGNLASSDATEGVLLPSSNISAVSTDIIHQEVQMMDPCGIGSSSLGEGSPANELIVLKSHFDDTAGSASDPENPNLASREATECVVFPPCNVDAGNTAIIHQEVQMMDSCNEESKNEQLVLNEVDQECAKEMKERPIVSKSTREGVVAEAQVILEMREEVAMKENFEKTSLKTSDGAEPMPMNNEMLAQPLPSPSVENCCDAGQSQKRQKDNEAMLASEDKDCGPIALLSIGGNALKIHESSISSTPLSESNAKFCAAETGNSCTDPAKPSCESPTVIRATELPQSGSKNKGVKGSADQNVPVPEGIDEDAHKVVPVTIDSKGNDTSKDEKTFTFEVSSLADSSKREAGQNWQPFSALQAGKVEQMVEGSPSTFGFGHLSSKSAQDVSQVTNRDIGRSGSKGGTSERKTRRAPSKAIGKETPKKGNQVKDMTSVRQSEKRGKTSNVSLSPSGIGHLVHPNEIQQYGQLDCSSMKASGVLTTSTSTLPDLNTSSSAAFQQPFTDLQQVQLRAQIFVYGALIQGIAPDESYMISAFGGPDGGRSIWETAWRASMERLQSQRSLLNNTETPMHSRSGARAPDQTTKHGAIQGKVTPSPLGRASSKGTPSPIVNPMIPLSSPLWSIPTPSGEAMQASGVPRSAVMDYQQALSPLHPLQTPPARNLAAHNTSWISQAPFRGTWFASPQTSTFETGARYPVLPITETVQLTPVKEPNVPHSSGVNHVSTGPTVQSMSPANAFPGTSPMLDLRNPMVPAKASPGISPMLDPRKVTVSPGQPSTDSKPRKRKKIPTSEAFSQIALSPQSQTEPVFTPMVTGYMSTSVAITTTASLFSKAPTEEVIMSLSPTTSTDHIRNGDQETHLRATLSEETAIKLKEARKHAEDAAAFAAAAVSGSEEIWNQMDKQKNSGLVPDAESKLASAAVAVAAAAAVAKAAAAAANVASSAALQAKLMADEALESSCYGDHGQSNETSHSDGVNKFGKSTPASILKGENARSGSSSIIFAAREAARRNVEAASAASKRAENMDAIVKAAELAAEAVSQAGKIVAMGDPLLLSELIEAGIEGYWKVPQASTQAIAKSNDVNGENLNINSVEEGPGTLAKHPKEVPLDDRIMQTTNQGKAPTLRETSGESFDDHARLVDFFPGSVLASGKNTKGQKGVKASDLVKTAGVVPGSEIESRSSSITVQIEHDKEMEPSKEASIKEGSCVEVFREGEQSKAAWFTANVLSLKDGEAYVCYTELPAGEGSEKLKEWVALKGERDKAPRIRIARPITAVPFEGTRKRRRAAMGEYNWSVGERVDAWMQDCWREGVITETNKKDENMFTVHFQGLGETAAIRAWHLRPSLIWKDGEWVEWSSSVENNRGTHEGDSPQEKRPKLSSPAVEAKGKDKTSKGISIVESGKPDNSKLLDLSANEKIFNIGKNTRVEKKPDASRMVRTGLQKEGARVIFGVPKPGKKRKFMDVSKHYVSDQGSKVNEANDSVKFTKYLMPQSQGSGTRLWKNASRSEPKEKRPALSKPKVLKSGKPPSVSGRTITQKDNVVSPAVSSDDSAATDRTAKSKDSASRGEITSGKRNLMEFQSSSSSGGAAATGPIQFSSMPLSSDGQSKKVSASNSRTERVTKGRLAPAGGKLTKIEEDKVLNSNSGKSTPLTEPRRSNRKIQPTSRLLEGLQSSLIISKIPSVSHDKSHKSQNRSTPRRE